MPRGDRGNRQHRDARPKLAATLGVLHARGINLHILTGICAGLHRPDGATIGDKVLFMVAAMAAEIGLISTCRAVDVPGLGTAA